MLYAVLVLVSLAAMTALMLVAASACRWVAVRALGVRGVPFPFGASARWCWTTGSIAPQAAGYVASLVGTYAVVAGVVAAGTWSAGIDAPDETSMRLTVDPGGPADAAGIHDGDRVDTVNGERVTTWDAFRHAVARHPREPVDVSLLRDGGEERVLVTPDGSGLIHVHMPVVRRDVGLGESLRMGAATPAVFLYETARAMVGTLGGSSRVEGGPVAIVRETRRQSQRGAGVVFLGMLGAYMLPFMAIAALFTGPGRRRRLRRDLPLPRR